MTGGIRTVPVVSVITDDEGLRSLGTEWDALVSDSPQGGIFLTWDWIRSWRETLGRHHDLRVVAARNPDDGALAALAPFAVEHRVRGRIRHRVLVMAGSGAAAPDHLDIVVRTGVDQAIAADVWSALQRHADWDLIDLDGVAADGHLARLLVRRRRDRQTVERIPCPYLALPATWKEFERGLGKNHRQSLRRYRRKLDREAAAPVTERLVIGPGDTTETLTRLGDLHQAIRTDSGDRGAFATDDLIAFHRLTTERFDAAGRLRLHRLDIGSDTAAAILCYRYGDTVAFYTTGYDPRWSRYGPGRRILARAIAGAIEEGATTFDLLRGDESYKDRWGASVRFDIRIRRPVGARGRLLWGLRFGAATGRRLIRRAPTTP